MPVKPHHDCAPAVARRFQAMCRVWYEQEACPAALEWLAAHVGRLDAALKALRREVHVLQRRGPQARKKIRRDAMQPFMLGDAVTWTSQSQGVIRTKTGTVIGIVPPNVSPWRILEKQGAALTALDGSYLDGAYVRSVESYLIRVAVFTDHGKPRRRSRVYWPLVRLLRKVEGEHG